MNRHPLRWKVLYNLAGDAWIYNTLFPMHQTQPSGTLCHFVFIIPLLWVCGNSLMAKMLHKKPRFSVPCTSLLFLCTRYDNRPKYWGMFVLWFYLSKTCKTKTARMLESNMYCTLQSQYNANLSFYFQKVLLFSYLNPFLKQLPKHKIQVLLRGNET